MLENRNVKNDYYDGRFQELLSATRTTNLNIEDGQRSMSLQTRMKQKKI